VTKRGWAVPFYRRRARRRGHFGDGLLFGLYFLCVVLLVLSRIGHDAVKDAHGQFSEISAPLLESAASPVVAVRHAWDRSLSYVNLREELDRAKQENESLKEWEWRAKQLERRLEHMRALLNAVDEPGLHYASGSVIADARGPFVRSALINIGRQHGVKVGYAVINGEGLVGRTVDTGDNVSRVLLLNDLNSRIPVLVGPAGVRAIAAGDNSGEMRIDFVPEGTTVYSGDEVYTSGSDGLLPRGLRVGVVAGGPGNYRVVPRAKLNELDFVSVLFFEAPALARTDPDSRAAGVLSAKPPITDAEHEEEAAAPERKAERAQADDPQTANP
jgi:rod shape-determining protein MreC